MKLSAKGLMLTPQVIVTSPDGNTILGSLAGSAAGKSGNYKVITDAVDSFLEGGEAPKQPTIFKWYVNESGFYKTTEMHGLTKDGVIIKTGKKPKILKFADIQPGGVKFAKRYIGALEEIKFGKQLKELRAGFTFPESETWTSSAGKAIDAKFVSLLGETLNLEVNKAGYARKKFSFTLDKLDEASQANAKKWQEVLAKQTAEEEELKKKLQ